jgi:hypothetical protein
MTLIEVLLLPSDDRVDRASIGRTLNAAVAEAIPCRLEAVWTAWRTIDGPFVRGGEASGEEAPERFGPIVHVYHHRTAEQVERIVDAIETVLARELSLERNAIFVTTQPVSTEDPTAR